MTTPNYLDTPEVIGLGVSIDFVELHLKQSEGEDTMSPQDMKLAIVTLKLALDRQMMINRANNHRLDVLEAEVNKPKRRFWKR